MSTRVALSVELATPVTLDARPAAACDLITANLLSEAVRDVRSFGRLEDLLRM